MECDINNVLGDLGITNPDWLVVCRKDSESHGVWALFSLHLSHSFLLLGFLSGPGNSVSLAWIYCSGDLLGWPQQGGRRDSISCRALCSIVIANFYTRLTWTLRQPRSLLCLIHRHHMANIQEEKNKEHCGKSEPESTSPLPAFPHGRQCLLRFL